MFFRRNHLIKIVIIFLLQLLAFNGFSNESLDEVNINLKNWSVNRISKKKLTGSWEFYWNQHIYPSEFRDNSNISPDLIVKLPGFWNNYEINKEKIGKDGFATYRTKLLLPDKHDNLSLKVDSVATSYRLFINGIEYINVGNAGVTKDNTSPENTPQVIKILEDSDELDIIFHVSNFHGLWGGLKNPIFIGLSDKLEWEISFSASVMLIMFGALIMGSIFFFFLYTFGAKINNILFLSIMCFAVGFNAIFGGDFYYHPSLPTLDWETGAKLQFLSLYVTFISLVFYFKSMYKEYIHTIWTTITYLIMFILFFSVLFGKYEQYSWQLLYFEFFLIIYIVYFLIITIVKLVKKEEGSKITFIGYSTFFISIISEIFQNNDFFIIQTEYILPIGLMCFVLSQSAVVFMKLLSFYQEKEIRSNSCYNYSKSLEKEINRKTKELLDLNQEKVEFINNFDRKTSEPINLLKESLEKLLYSENIKDEASYLKNSFDREYKNYFNFLDIEKIFLGVLKYNHSTGANFKTIFNKVKDKEFNENSKKLKIVSNIPNSDPFLYIHPIALEKVLSNICSYSMKFSEVIIDCILGESVLKIDFRCIGCAIDNDTINYVNSFNISLFNKEEYNKVDNGLLLVKTLIDETDNSFQISTESSNCTRITIEIALIDKLSTKNVISEGDILVLAKDMNIRNKIEKMLTNSYNLHIFKDRNSSLEFIERELVPNLVISDVMIKGSFDVEFFDFFRTNNKFIGVPLLFVVDGNNELDILDYYNGVYDILKLPINNNLFLHVKSLIDINTHTSRIENAKKNTFNINCNNFQLTDRQVEIVKLILHGKSNKEISYELNISVNTVARHLQNIFEKVSVKSRFELISLMTNE